MGDFHRLVNREVQSQIHQAGVPRVSVLVPVKNEEGYIKQCLGQIVRQNYPMDRLEVLVIDGRSTDGTRMVVAKMMGDVDHLHIRLIDDPRGQRASGLNAGIAAARGEVVARVDARTILPPDYIAQCVETLQQQDADNVGGVVRPLSRTLTQKAIGLAMSHPFGVGDAQFRVGKKSGLVDSVYLGCFRKAILERVGLFDEDAPIIAEDSDINQRIRSIGGKVYLNTDIAVFYYPREKLAYLWRLYFRYGGARAGFLIKHRKLTSWRQLASPALLVMVFLLAIMTFCNTLSFLALVGLLGAYVAIDAVVSIRLSADNRQPILLFPLMLSFPCMHIAWGLGFFRRLFQATKPGAYWAY